jgi:hypothetical protein
MVIGDCEREKAWASPCHVIWKGEFLYILSETISTKKRTPRVRKKSPNAKKALKFLTLIILSESSITKRARGLRSRGPLELVLRLS